MCGEKAKLYPSQYDAKGSPPACAGRRKFLDEVSRPRGDHPRVCGEKLGRCRACRREAGSPRVCGEKKHRTAYTCRRWGSPPRVRGEEQRIKLLEDLYRITPACAGRSVTNCHFRFSFWDHPRVCGEKVGLKTGREQHIGSPPRVRGEVSAHWPNFRTTGITPACAGRR